MGRKRGKNRRNSVKLKKNRRKVTVPQNGDFEMLNYLNKLQENVKKNGGVSDGKVKPIGFKTTITAPVEECWESGIEVINNCGTAPDSIPVTIGPIAQAKINALMQEYPRIEWLAYLLGNPDNPYHVEDIAIPKQVVTTVRVDVDEQGINVPTIGVIHSHHGMGNGFSGTDHAYINQNHDISLCISHGGIAGQVRVKTDCNKYVIVKANVLQGVEGFDHQSFISEAKTLITEKTFNTNFNRGVNNSNISRLGIGEFDEEDGEELFSITELSTYFREDVENFPTTFDVIDLVGMREIIGEVCRQDRNYDVFATLYNNFIDSDPFADEDENNIFLNSPMELLDIIDTGFKTITPGETSELVRLFKALKEAITLCEQELEENKEEEVEPTLPGDEDLWNASEENKCCVCNSTDVLVSSNGGENKEADWYCKKCWDDKAWNTDDSVDTSDISKDDSDNIWNTVGNG